jgi:RNA polymerase sigma factor (sigma-70 family)
MSMSDTELRALIEGALSGSSEQAQALVEVMAPIVQVRVARTLWKRHQQARRRDPRQDLEDLVQEVFVALFAEGGRVLRSWDPARGLGFAGFIGFIAEREVAMRMRVMKKNPWTEDPTVSSSLFELSGTAPSLESRLEARDLVAQVLERMSDHLTPMGRHYFQLLWLEERSVQSVAEETGASLDSLYAWRSRLGKLLRQVGAELA